MARGAPASAFVRCTREDVMHPCPADLFLRFYFYCSISTEHRRYPSPIDSWNLITRVVPVVPVVSVEPLASLINCPRAAEREQAVQGGLLEVDSQMTKDSPISILLSC